jgi:flavin reductase (DIM6/NTAB) family NADH-FMN oxidoreductase RutF
MSMPARELHALFAFYICPRPVVLVSVQDEARSNIFPMDLIGSVAPGYFSMALHSTSSGASLIESSRRVALSSVPIDQTAVAYELGKNHKRVGFCWDDVPFRTTLSSTFGIPIPDFALRVRELQIEDVRSLGSHRFFLGRIVRDEWRSQGSQLFFIHGFYQAWRQRTDRMIERPEVPGGD